MSPLAQQIEKHLLEARGWVTTSELEIRFKIRDRQLRTLHGQPGLCSEFAISGNNGFKHVRYATDAEFTRADQRVRKHAIGELIAVEPPPVHEKATGQGVMVL